jgi:alpha-L-fucosidase 2
MLPFKFYWKNFNPFSGIKYVLGILIIYVYKKLKIFTCIFLSLCFSCNKEQILTDSPFDLKFDELAKVWDDAIPLGNGNIGALVWKKGDNLRLSLDRADLWDNRPMLNRNIPEFSFSWVKAQRMKNDPAEYRKVQVLFDDTYLSTAAPTKLPGGYLEFNVKKYGKAKSVKLFINEAICEVEWETGLKLQTFVHAEKPVGYFRFTSDTGVFPSPELIAPEYSIIKGSSRVAAAPYQDLGSLGYEKGKVVKTANSISYHQVCNDGFEYIIDVRWKKTKNKGLEGTWSIVSKDVEKKIAEECKDITKKTLDKGFETIFKEHKNWWKRFWNKSSISIPDSTLMRQWYLDQYKFGSVARANAPPIGLQAVWTADNGKLPPWKGDYHNDLNTQLSYWSAYSSNHLDLEMGFINWMWDHRDNFKKYTKDFYGTSGINVPGVSTLEGEPMGGWIQYALGPTVSSWLAHHFYLHWRYSMDRDFLEKRAYPWFQEVAIYLNELSEIGDNGKRKLPLSTSPEYHAISKYAWYNKHSSFDVGLIKFTFVKIIELAKELGKYSEAVKWEKDLSEWDLEYPIDETGLLLAPGYRYEHSHWHFSHLIAFHPLGLLDRTNGKEDEALIRRTIEHCEMIEQKDPRWVGYIYSWLGGMKARLFDGEGAADALNKFVKTFVTENSFHSNGDYKRLGISNTVDRYFTLEANFAFASGIQEMLIQSHTGIVRVFPAIPKSWKEVSFNKLRTEGAFLISAKRRGGKTIEVKIQAEKGGTLTMTDPFATAPFESSGKKVDKEGGNIVIITEPDEIIKLTLK